MRRFWISVDQIKSQSASHDTDMEAHIEGELFHHIRDVCRFDVGSRFELLPGDGRALFVEVSRVAKKNLVARVIEVRQIPPLPRPLIHLFVSIPRFATFETILEKASELGVAEITPFFSDYSFVRSHEKLTPSRLGRWDKIIRSASQQCGRGHLPQLNSASRLKDILDNFNPQTKVLGLFPYEGEAALSLKQQLAAQQEQNFEKVWLFVGSEGGFSHKEVQLFESKGLPPVTMGDQILRVETACLALVSVIKYHFEA